MASHIRAPKTPLRQDVADEGQLWSARSRDWAEVQEEFLDPCYVRILEVTRIAAGAHVLDIGCGSGRFLQLAAARGAGVTGLDAARGMLEIAAARVPEGLFHVGDMEMLPFEDGMFDLVSGFNSFSHADDPVAALREAGRVAKPGKLVTVTVWGPPMPGSVRTVVLDIVRSAMKDENDNAHIVQDDRDPAPSGSPHHSVTAADDLEGLLKDAGLDPEGSGEVECLFFYPDDRVLLRGLMSPGPLVEAAQRTGEEKLRQAILEGMEPFRDASGAYRFSNDFRYVIGRVPAG